jgi:Winged helix DNA-binding domain
MDLVVRLRAWSHSRQRLRNPARTPEDALRSVVAVYATHPTSPLALAVRTRSLTGDQYRRIDRDRKGVRIPAMRKTLFLVPRKSAARVFAATRPPTADAQRRLERNNLTATDFARIGKRVLRAAQEPITAKDLGDAIGMKGQALGAVLRNLRHEGRVLALAGDSLMMSGHRYVATTAWLPEGLGATANPVDALAWLAGEYLRAYGPARIEDFAWWAGVNKKAAVGALEGHRTVDVGDGLLLHRRDESEFDRVKRLSGSVELLPRWDAYTMGHAPDGRHRFVHPDVQERVYTPMGTGLPGDGNPVLLVDGEAVGVWTYTHKEGARVHAFDTLGPSLRRKVDARLEAVVGLLSQ